jgi:hypothetical protein
MPAQRKGGQRETMQEPNGWERDGLQVNLDHPKMFHSWEAKGRRYGNYNYGSRHVQVYVHPPAIKKNPLYCKIK